MSISSIQMKRKKDEFTQILVRKGIEPNNYELNKMLTEYFDGHTLGMPYYSPVKQKPYEQSNSADYNHNFKTFEEDIQTVYQANIEANNKAVAMQEYYDLEKNKIINSISKLSLRVKNIEEALKTASNVKQYIQVFDDLYDVEFYGNAKRNIPYTTSFVDLMQKCIYTEKSNNKVNKLSMDNASLSITDKTSFDIIKTEGAASNVLSDIANASYTIAASTSKEEEKFLELTIDLGSLMSFNTVMFSFTSSREMICELSLSEDGTNYITAYDITSFDFCEWNFNTKTARYIRIRCLKSEPDGIEKNNNGSSFYQYYYILKNISIAKEEFESKSVFVSKVIDFDDLTDTIKLDATDMIFNNTRIDYFIGFDNGSDKIGWDAIENHKDHALFMFTKKHKIANFHVNEFGIHGGILNAYKIFTLPDTVNRNSIKITPGYNMWSVLRYNRKTEDTDDGFTLDNCDFTNHISKCTRTQLFMDCENYSDFNIQTNVLYIFTQYVSLSEPKNLYNTMITVAENNDTRTKIDNAEIKIFLNGYEITADDNGFYSFGLHKGVNKVQIAVYVPNTTASAKKLYHSINFKSLTNDVFGFVPMKYTNNTVLDKMIGDNYEYYTIKNNCIYVKCNPDDMIYSNLEDMGYFITYSCIREDMAGYFKDNHIKFRIMAVLSSNDKNLSPKLINFRITGR